jgi:chromosome segregation ATPase
MSALEVIKQLDEMESEFSSNKKRLTKLENEFNQTKKELEEHKKVLAKEQKDVDNLDKARLNHIFLRLVGKMDEKVEKEERELLQAKVRFEELTYAVSHLEKDVSDIRNRLILLKEEITKVREDGARVYIEVKNRNAQLENIMVHKKSEILEIDQAIIAGNDVLSSLDETSRELKSAEGWSTWDTFGGGGFLSDMIKYDKMDNAQRNMNQLSRSIRKFRAELKDVSIHEQLEFKGVGMGTKTFDIFFDNIFSDWSVRSKIQENSRQLDGIENHVVPILTTLRNRKSDIQKDISEMEIN